MMGRESYPLGQAAFEVEATNRDAKGVGDVVGFGQAAQPQLQLHG
jgi:hypothetical protein